MVGACVGARGRGDLSGSGGKGALRGKPECMKAWFEASLVVVLWAC